MFRNYPIASHRQAFKAAEAAECAGEQGKFWEMHGRLFANQQNLAPADLSRNAQMLGLNSLTFQQCLDSGLVSAKIARDVTDARAAGVSGTPVFFIGPTSADGAAVQTVTKLEGAKRYADFKEALDDLLAQYPGR